MINLFLDSLVIRAFSWEVENRDLISHTNCSDSQAACKVLSALPAELGNENQNRKIRGAKEAREILFITQ